MLYDTAAVTDAVHDNPTVCVPLLGITATT
jgi:hypothetical protein